MSDTVDSMYEEYMRLQYSSTSHPGDTPSATVTKTLVTRQCAYHPGTKKSAVQYLVGSYMERAPKGHI